jgi:hypothetical protein
VVVPPSLSLVACGVAVRVAPSTALPLTDTVSVGATSVTEAVATLVAVVPPPSLSVDVAITRNWCASFDSPTRKVELVAPEMLDQVEPLRDCH